MLLRVLLLCLLLPSLAFAEVRRVTNSQELRATLPLLKDGDTLRIAKGEYPGGNAISGIRDLTIEGESSKAPPHFKGGKEAWHFTRTPGLNLRHIRVSGQTANGINIDDGGDLEHPVESILLEHVHVEDIGPKGNFDGIKCSGLKDLTIRECFITGWGGQAIDLVGCRDVLITDCRIKGKAEGFSQATGPQFKGGCENVILERCQLIHAGARPVQLGGSTGDPYFRPPGAKFEAKNVTVRDCYIEGGECAAAFTGVIGAEFVSNKISLPGKWVFRILWEKRSEGFGPTSDVKISRNQITYRKEDVTHAFNLSEGSDLNALTFKDNQWLAEDLPEKSIPEILGKGESQ